MEDHAMSHIRNGYVVSARRGFLGGFVSALLALALFDTGAAIAQEVTQIKLTEKRIQGFMAASKDIALGLALRDFRPSMSQLGHSRPIHTPSAVRVMLGAICLSSSSHFPLRLYSNCMKPVALPPGRDSLATNPEPTRLGDRES
jgi:hypothetical protein